MINPAKFSEAVALAAEAHQGQIRKGAGTPYLAHPLAVAALVLEFGGDQDQAIGALLHDVLEDGGAHYAQQIRQQFGARVLSIVEACTDGVPDETGQKAPWQGRKERYLAHLGEAPDDALLVSACDKLCNAKAILDDLIDPDVGLAVFDRFSASKDKTLWYYSELAGVFSMRRSPVARKLAATVAEIKQLAGA